MITTGDIISDMDAPEDFGRGHGHKPKTRKDIASGLQRNPAEMLRFAVGPDGTIVPDILGKLPGRGIWAGASRGEVETAIKQKAFARAAKKAVKVPADLAGQIERGLKLRVLNILGMAKKGGALETGFDNMRSLARSGKMAYRVEASDGADEGRGKIRAIAKSAAIDLEQPAPPVLGIFTAKELGAVIGRDNVVHMGIKKSKIAKSLHENLTKLSGFCALIPDAWPDKQHEPNYLPYEGPSKGQ